MEDKTHKLIAEAISEFIYCTFESDVDAYEIDKALELLDDVEITSITKDELATILLQRGF